MFEQFEINEEPINYGGYDTTYAEECEKLIIRSNRERTQIIQLDIFERELNRSVCELVKLIKTYSNNYKDKEMESSLELIYLLLIYRRDLCNMRRRLLEMMPNDDSTVRNQICSIEKKTRDLMHMSTYFIFILEASLENKH